MFDDNKDENKAMGAMNEDDYTELVPSEETPVQEIVEESSLQSAVEEEQPESDVQDSVRYDAESAGRTAGDSQNGAAEEINWTRPQNYYQQEKTERYASYEFSGEETAEKPVKKKKGVFGTVVKAAAAGLAFGLLAYGGFALLNHFAGPLVVKEKVNSATPVVNTTTTAGGSGNVTNASARVYDVSDVTEAVMPSVVAIVSKGTTQIPTFWGTQSQDFQSSGSGVIVGSNDEELLIATNNHVITDAESLEITFADDTKADAVVKGKSSEMDLAVVAVKLSDLDEDTMDSIKIATLGDSTAVKVGEPAIAIGNALGYGQSVTFGVISALDREVTVQTDSTYGFGNSETITSKLIQTDAAINPGNSGGALFNINGEVIGINSVKYASSEVEGMGYAIPITAAQPILDELMNRKTKEKVDESKSAYMGIVGAEVTSDAQSIYGMPKGAYVVSVEEDSAAEKAGIKKGDIIVKFDDTTIASFEDLQEELQYYASGDAVDLVVARSDSGEYVEQTLHITLDKRPEND